MPTLPLLQLRPQKAAESGRKRRVIVPCTAQRSAAFPVDGFGEDVDCFPRGVEVSFRQRLHEIVFHRREMPEVLPFGEAGEFFCNGHADPKKFP
jgi:hypothetical protein